VAAAVLDDLEHPTTLLCAARSYPPEHAGQFEDLDAEAERILLDDDRPSAAPSAEAPAPTTAMPKAAPQPAAPPAAGQ